MGLMGVLVRGLSIQRYPLRFSSFLSVLYLVYLAVDNEASGRIKLVFSQVESLIFKLRSSLDPEIPNLK